MKRLVVGIREKERVCQDISTEMDGIVNGSRVLKVYNNLEKAYKVVFFYVKFKAERPRFRVKRAV